MIFEVSGEALAAALRAAIIAQPLLSYVVHSWRPFAFFGARIAIVDDEKRRRHGSPRLFSHRGFLHPGDVAEGEVRSPFGFGVADDLGADADRVVYADLQEGRVRV